MLTTLTWFGGKNSFLPIAYLVSGGLIFIVGVVLTVVYVKVGRDGKNMEEWHEEMTEDDYEKMKEAWVYLFLMLFCQALCALRIFSTLKEECSGLVWADWVEVDIKL